MDRSTHDTAIGLRDSRRIELANEANELDSAPVGLFAPPDSDPGTRQDHSITEVPEAAARRPLREYDASLRLEMTKALRDALAGTGVRVGALKTAAAELPPTYSADANGDLPPMYVFKLRIDEKRTVVVRVLAEPDLDTARVAEVVAECAEMHRRLPKVTLDTLNFDRQFQMPYMGDMRGVLAYFWPGKSAIHFPADAVSKAMTRLANGEEISEGALYDRRVLSGRPRVQTGPSGEETVTRRWFVPTTKSPLGAVFQHEFGHRIARQIMGHDENGWNDVLDAAAKQILGDTPESIVRFRKILNPNIPRDVRTRGFEKEDWDAIAKLRSVLSEYGTYSMREFEAEVLCEYFGSSQPSDLARLIGKTVETYLGGRGSIREDEAELILPAETAPEVSEAARRHARLSA